MKIRVIGLESGEEIILNVREDLFLTNDGRVVIDGQHGIRDITDPYIVEFAFRKDEDNQWIWEHSVIHN